MLTPLKACVCICYPIILLRCSILKMYCVSMYPIAVNLLFLSISVAFEKQCGENQTERNDFCCFPIVCKEGSNQIPKACEFDGGTDTCVDCPKNTCNAARINSLQVFYFSHLCKPTHTECDMSSLGGTLPYNNNATCEVTCKCDRLRGFYNYNPRFKDCQKGDTICPDKTTWLNDSGQCEKCADGLFQDDKYGECVSLNQPPNHPTTQQTSTVSTTEGNIIANTTAAEQEGSNLVPVYVGGSIAFVVVVIIVVVAVIVRQRIVEAFERRRARHGNTGAQRAARDLRIREPFLRVDRPPSNAIELTRTGQVPNPDVPHANGAPQNANGVGGGV